MQQKQEQTAANKAVSRKQMATRKKHGPLAQMRRRMKRLPIPDLGPLGTVFGLVGLIGGTVATGLVLAVTLRAFIQVDAFNPFRDTEVINQGTPVATPNPEFLAPTVDFGGRVWPGQERVTILLMGTDARPSDQGYRTRTDTMMLLMIDPRTQHASILSIPRDLYVDVPGQGLNRINTAYVYGGGQLAVDTIEYNLGIPVDYYVVVDFNVLVTLVDEIGGIDINVPKTIYDPEFPDQNYGYDPFYIEAGQQHLDGATALKYARTRHADNDYERARRQQAVVMAIRDKILSVDMLPTLIQKAPALYAALSNNITTDMRLEDMISLARLAEEVTDENIRRGVIDSNYVNGYYTPQGSSVLIPDREKVSELLHYVFWLDE